MPIDPDFVREDRIKKLRTLAKAGQAHMLTLHQAVPTYLRQGRATEEKLDAMFAATGGSAFRRLAGPELSRDWDIRVGVMADAQQTDKYRKISKWLVEVESAADTHLSDELHQRYTALAEPTALNPSDHEGPTVEERIVALGSDIEARVALIAEQLRLDGEHEDVTPALRDASGGWPHLRGLIDSAVLDGYLSQMRKRRSKTDISAAIGAAKELVEATLQARAVELGVPSPGSKPDLADWWRALKPHLADASVDKALGSKDGAVLKLLSSQIATIQNLGELRNRVGTGHGKSSHPAGLSAQHALLAVDIAHSVTRFVMG